jgi:hypothetical protein
MVPVGRLTLLRTFAKSELIRAVGFVQIAGLIDPILGPIAGGAIVGIPFKIRITETVMPRRRGTNSFVFSFSVS